MASLAGVLLELAPILKDAKAALDGTSVFIIELEPRMHQGDAFRPVIEKGRSQQSGKKKKRLTQ